MTALAVFLMIAFLAMWSWGVRQAWVISDLLDNIEVKQCVLQTMTDRHAQQCVELNAVRRELNRADEEIKRLAQVRPPEGIVAYGSQRAGGERG